MRDAFTMPFGIGAGAALAGGTLAAAMNLFETDDSYIVQVPLPGVRPDQLNITARENILTIQGTLEVAPPSGARGLYQGMSRGQFRDQLKLPGDVDAQQAMATYENGILTLRLPKAASAREHTIRVNLGQGQGQYQGQSQSQGQSQGQGQSH